LVLLTHFTQIVTQNSYSVTVGEVDIVWEEIAPRRGTTPGHSGDASLGAVDMPFAATARPLSIPRQDNEPTSAALEAITAGVWKHLLGTSLRPFPRWSPFEVAVSASVPVNGASPAVTVLSAPASVATVAAVAILGLQEDELAPGDIEDAFGDLVLAIGSEIRTLLSDETRLGPPSVVHGAGLSTAVPGARLACEARLKSAAGPVQVSLWSRRATYVG
jgi:hypothetical protein